MRAHTSVTAYDGFTEHAYRLAFEYANISDDRFSSADPPRLRTVLPSGVVENEEKVLVPKAEKGLLAYGFAQSIDAEKARTHVDTPFVWKRDDGSFALVQTWSTNMNDKFKQEFSIATSNPDTSVYSPQAVEEFERVVKALFGEDATDKQPVVYCHRASENDGPVYVGSGDDLLNFLRNDPHAVTQLNIQCVLADGFVSTVVNRNGDGTKAFKMAQGVEYVVYVKRGWDTMACATPLDQFVRGRVLHGDGWSVRDRLH